MRRWWIASTALLAACATSTGAVETEITTAPTPVPTVAGVGSLPGTIPATSPPATEPLVVITRPLNADGDEAELIGDQVGGNRLLMIGDSIFAGTENRYGGEMCAGLEPLGWAVEVAAEAGRFVEFGVKVVNRNVPESESESEFVTTDGDPVPAGDDDWDAAAVFLGSNYNGNQDNYDSEMREILDRLAPRPTLLYTVTEYRSNYAEVNEVIDDLVADYPNVTLIDWAEAAETPGVLRSDGLHPNDAGEQVLVDLTAAALGDAPEGEADCIRSRFRDDSAIKDGSGSPNTNGSGGSSSSGSSSGGSSSSSSSSGGGSSSSSSGGTSSGSGGSSSTGGGTDGTDTDGTTTDGTDTDGSGTDGTDTDGTGTDGTDTDGTGTDGSDTDGSGTDGSGTDGSGTDGSGTDGSGTDGSGTDGSSSDGSGTDGSGTDGSGTDGSGTDGSGTDGSGTDGGSTGTTGSSGGSSDGSATTDGSATDAGE